MLINLKSHINMKHTQMRNKKEEENISGKKGWTITKQCLLNVVEIFNPK